jgi:hypothetical protein
MPVQDWSAMASGTDLLPTVSDLPHGDSMQSQGVGSIRESRRDDAGCQAASSVKLLVVAIVQRPLEI